MASGVLKIISLLLHLIIIRVSSQNINIFDRQKGGSIVESQGGYLDDSTNDSVDTLSEFINTRNDKFHEKYIDNNNNNNDNAFYIKSGETTLESSRKEFKFAPKFPSFITGIKMNEPKTDNVLFSQSKSARKQWSHPHRHGHNETPKWIMTDVVNKSLLKSGNLSDNNSHWNIINNTKQKIRNERQNLKSLKSNESKQKERGFIQKEQNKENQYFEKFIADVFKKVAKKQKTFPKFRIGKMVRERYSNEKRSTTVASEKSEVNNRPQVIDAVELKNYSLSQLKTQNNFFNDLVKSINNLTNNFSTFSSSEDVIDYEQDVEEQYNISSLQDNKHIYINDQIDKLLPDLHGYNHIFNITHDNDNGIINETEIVNSQDKNTQTNSTITLINQIPTTTSQYDITSRLNIIDLYNTTMNINVVNQDDTLGNTITTQTLIKDNVEPVTETLTNLKKPQIESENFSTEEFHHELEGSQHIKEVISGGSIDSKLRNVTPLPQTTVKKNRFVKMEIESINSLTWLELFFCQYRNVFWMMVNSLFLICILCIGLLSLYRLMWLRSCSSLVPRTFYLVAHLMAFTGAAFQVVQLLHLLLGSDEGLPLILTLLLVHTPTPCLAVIIWFHVHCIFVSTRITIIGSFTPSSFQLSCGTAIIITLSFCGDLITGVTHSTLFLLICRSLVSLLLLLPPVIYVTKHSQIQQVSRLLHREFQGELKLLVVPVNDPNRTDHSDVKHLLRERLPKWSWFVLISSIIAIFMILCNWIMSIFFTASYISILLWWVVHALDLISKCLLIIFFVMSSATTLQEDEEGKSLFNKLIIPPSALHSESKPITKRGNFIYERVSYSSRADSSQRTSSSQNESEDQAIVKNNNPTRELPIPPVKPKATIKRSATFNGASYRHLHPRRVAEPREYHPQRSNCYRTSSIAQFLPQEYHVQGNTMLVNEGGFVRFKMQMPAPNIIGPNSNIYIMNNENINIYQPQIPRGYSSLRSLPPKSPSTRHDNNIFNKSVPNSQYYGEKVQQKSVQQPSIHENELGTPVLVHSRPVSRSTSLSSRQTPHNSPSQKIYPSASAYSTPMYSPKNSHSRKGELLTQNNLAVIECTPEIPIEITPRNDVKRIELDKSPPSNIKEVTHINKQYPKLVSVNSFQTSSPIMTTYTSVKSLSSSNSRTSDSSSHNGVHITQPYIQKSSPILVKSSDYYVKSEVPVYCVYSNNQLENRANLDPQAVDDASSTDNREMMNTTPVTLKSQSSPTIPVVESDECVINTTVPIAQQVNSNIKQPTTNYATEIKFPPIDIEKLNISIHTDNVINDANKQDSESEFNVPSIAMPNKAPSIKRNHSTAGCYYPPRRQHSFNKAMANESKDSEFSDSSYKRDKYPWYGTWGGRKRVRKTICSDSDSNSIQTQTDVRLRDNPRRLSSSRASLVSLYGRLKSARREKLARQAAVDREDEPRDYSDFEASCASTNDDGSRTGESIEGDSITSASKYESEEEKEEYDSKHDWALELIKSSELLTGFYSLEKKEPKEILHRPKIEIEIEKDALDLKEL